MPYITKDRREALDRDQSPDSAGELNYCLTWHLLNSNVAWLPETLRAEVEDYIDSQPLKNYAMYNAVIGALECCRREWRRRRGPSTTADLAREDAIRATLDYIYDTHVVPYENGKIEQNGDVYTCI